MWVVTFTYALFQILIVCNNNTPFPPRIYMINFCRATTVRTTTTYLLTSYYMIFIGMIASF